MKPMLSRAWTRQVARKKVRSFAAAQEPSGPRPAAHRHQRAGAGTRPGDLAEDEARGGSHRGPSPSAPCSTLTTFRQASRSALTEKFAAKVASLPTCDPANPATVVGPVINDRAARHVADLVAEAVAQGARIRAGGGDPVGANFPATVLDQVTPDMRIYREEIFGPAVTVITVDSDDAIAIANDTEYGLTAGVITQDSGRGFAIARRLRTGIVHVGNQTIDDEPQAPFGGVKSTGYGRFGGRWGVEAFTDTRWVTVAGEHGQFPF